MLANWWNWLLTPQSYDNLNQRIIEVLWHVQKLKNSIAAVESLGNLDSDAVPLAEAKLEKRHDSLEEGRKILQQLEAELSLYSKQQIDNAIREHKRA